MTVQKSTKLNQMINSWPPGAVYTCSALKDMGYQGSLITHYRRQKWLQAVGNGAVARYSDKIDWTGGLYAIQKQLKLKIHAGGKAALTLRGSSHFLPLGNMTVTLYGASKVRLPTWFKTYAWLEKISYHTSNLFGEEYELGLEEYQRDSYGVTISSRERAIMELLHLVPKEESFEESKLIMENLRTLRPNLVQQLLEACSSVKVKRLFLLYAEELALPWFERLDLNAIDLGAGKRHLAKGDRLHSKYLVTVPATLFGEEG